MTKFTHSASVWSHCLVQNIISIILRRPQRLYFDDKRGLYYVEDGALKIYIAHPRRGRRYRRGIANLIKRLAGHYYFDEIKTSPGDCFIECGANIGELSFWARDRELSYYAFEPDNIAADACDLNAFDGQTKVMRVCLWKEKTNLKFYEKTDTADSTVFEIEKYDKFYEVPAITLDDFCQEREIYHIKLLKVEAEGAEPEVLLGSLKMLSAIDYIAVDCGYERGMSQKHTLIEVNRILSENGFVMTQARMKKRYTFLFENKTKNC